MKICAVIVTYGDRFMFLNQVINSCVREKIGKIIVIDNNSSASSRNQLKGLEEKEKKLKVIYLKENKGSAGGYKIGLEEAYKDKNCEYLLMLDDDNVILPGSIEKIKCLLIYLSRYKKDEIMLAIYRPKRKWDRRSVYDGWIKSYKPNNFRGFNLWDRISNKFKKIFINKYLKEKNILYPLQPAEVTAMGGLFFHRKIIDKIGYPREEFYLYGEDHEYTYRFTKKGGRIFVCSEAIIEDLDSTYLSEKKEKLHFFHEDFSEMKLYYSVRNHTYLSKLFATNKIFFYGNLIVYSLLLFKYIPKTPIKLFFKRYRLYLRALKDGLSEKLGKSV